MNGDGGFAFEDNPVFVRDQRKRERKRKGERKGEKSGEKRRDKGKGDN